LRAAPAGAPGGEAQVHDAWIDTGKRDPQGGQVGFVGYEINFYRYTPPRPLEEIEADIRGIEKDILGVLAGLTGGPTWGQHAAVAKC
jgi:hypothetical protein